MENADILNRSFAQHNAFISKLCAFGNMLKQVPIFMSFLSEPQIVQKMMTVGDKISCKESKACVLQLCEVCIATNEMLTKEACALFALCATSKICSTDQVTAKQAQILYDFALAGYLCLSQNEKELVCVPTVVGFHLFIVCMCLAYVDVEQIYQRMEELRGI